MEPVLILAAQATGTQYSVVIDGITYTVASQDTVGRLIVVPIPEAVTHTGGVFTAPVANTVLADTGALVAGVWEVFICSRAVLLPSAPSSSTATPQTPLTSGFIRNRFVRLLRTSLAMLLASLTTNVSASSMTPPPPRA